MSTLDSTWRFVGKFTRTPITLHPDIQTNGDEVQLIARWVTLRGETGRFGSIASIKLLKPSLMVMKRTGMRLVA